MANVLIVTTSPGGTTVPRLTDAFALGGHVTSTVLPADLATVDLTGVDVIVAGYQPYDTTVSAWLSARWAEGYPIFLTGIHEGITSGSTNHFATRLGFCTAQTLNPSVSYRNGSYRMMRLAELPDHPIMAEYRGRSSVNVTTDAQWYSYALAPRGTNLGFRNLDVSGAMGIALERGDAISSGAVDAPGPTAPARAAYFGWAYADGTVDYTEDGKRILARTISWLAHEDLTLYGRLVEGGSAHGVVAIYQGGYATGNSTVAVTASEGDVLMVSVDMENPFDPSVSGLGLVWSEVTAAAGSDSRVWTATATADVSGDITTVGSGDASKQHGTIVFVVRGVTTDGLEASSATTTMTPLVADAGDVVVMLASGGSSTYLFDQYGSNSYRAQTTPTWPSFMPWVENKYGSSAADVSLYAYRTVHSDGESNKISATSTSQVSGVRLLAGSQVPRVGAELGATAALEAGVVLIAQADAGLIAVGALTATAARVGVYRDADLTGSGVLTADVVAVQMTSGTLAGSGAFSATSASVDAVVALLDGSGELSAIAELVRPLYYVYFVETDVEASKYLVESVGVEFLVFAVPAQSALIDTGDALIDTGTTEETEYASSPSDISVIDQLPTSELTYGSLVPAPFSVVS